MKDDNFYLIHMNECLGDIQEYTSGGRDAFYVSKLIQDAVLRKLQIMVQSSMQLSDSFREVHSEIAWNKMRGFRNFVVHEYLEIDLDAVWYIVENDLPPLVKAVKAAIRGSKDTE
ncbi:MAG: DUF86 domain-containing protein [Anaerolineae bacterium]|nr:DUF86 domain-containing protein [Anaerolineae bacterium]